MAAVERELTAILEALGADAGGAHDVELKEVNSLKGCRFLLSVQAEASKARLRAVLASYPRAAQVLSEETGKKLQLTFDSDAERREVHALYNKALQKLRVLPGPSLLLPPPTLPPPASPAAAVPRAATLAAGASPTLGTPRAGCSAHPQQRLKVGGSSEDLLKEEEEENEEEEDFGDVEFDEEDEEKDEDAC